MLTQYLKQGWCWVTCLTEVWTLIWGLLHQHCSTGPVTRDTSHGHHILSKHQLTHSAKYLQDHLQCATWKVNEGDVKYCAMMKNKPVSFTTVTDLQDLLAKNGSLPSYVSKEHVCQDITQVLESKNITKKQKNEVSLTIINLKIFFEY